MGVGELEVTPVSAAIARHLGIDLSSEGKAARNRRGISIIINGAPMSGIPCQTCWWTELVMTRCSIFFTWFILLKAKNTYP